VENFATEQPQYNVDITY